MSDVEFDQYGQIKKESNLPVVKFYYPEPTDSMLDPAASAREGRPIYRIPEMVRIQFPADKQSTLERPAAAVRKMNGRKVSYKERFPEQYRRFKADEIQVVDGTPLKEASFLSVGQKASLKALNVYTVEQLASLSGQPLKNLGTGGLAMQQAAAAWLDQAKGFSDVTRLAAENAKLKETLAQMQTQQPKAAPGPYDGMSDDQIKELIAERAGSKPRGNPARATLERMADDLSATMVAAE